MNKFTLLNALLYVVKNGCKWRALSENAKNHVVNVVDKAAVSFSLSCGEKGDSPEGQKLLNFFSWTERIRVKR